MPSRRSLRQLFVAVLLGVMVGGGLMAITPAGAEVSQSLATSWKKIWKKELKPLADKRYYTKAKSDSTYATKAESAAAAAAAQSAAQSAANAATDTKLGGYYKKAESDSRYAPIPALYRGVYMFGGNPGAANETVYGDISFGATFPSAPTTHYIKVGDPVPSGCSGTAAAPNAAAGNLCIFETEGAGAVSSRGFCNPAAGTCFSGGVLGVGLFAKSSGAGVIEIMGTWAARPSAAVVNPGFAPAPSGAVNGTRSPGEVASAR